MQNKLLFEKLFYFLRKRAMKNPSVRFSWGRRVTVPPAERMGLTPWDLGSKEKS